jgi:hypothetical protein
MRLGKNPAKNAPSLPGYGRHRLIVPVYFPPDDPYYTQAVPVLRLCLTSLRETTQERASLTVISNGCADVVVAELQQRQAEGSIDQLILNSCNRGRVDALLAAARGAFEDLITVTDCDVLFKHGWLEATEAILERFPECGVVTPHPLPNLAWYHTSATVLGALVRSELGTDRVVPSTDLDRFARSVGNATLFTDAHRSRQLIVKRGDTIACVGASHFVATFRREVIRALPHAPQLLALGHPGRDGQWLDAPVDRAGFWRLATPRAFVHHMGNTLEQWMVDEADGNGAGGDSSTYRIIPAPRRAWVSRLPWSARTKAAGVVRRLSEGVSMWASRR